MPKASKSSASSGTRKKHARKAAGPSTGSNIIPQNTKTKPSKKEIKKGLAPPPKKSYIPPSKLKPAAPQVDPLINIEYLLPAELVVVLKKLAKKDGVTKIKALEDLEAWVRSAIGESKGPTGSPGKLDTLVVMLPVWLHRYPALCVHQSRRIRYRSVSLHALLLEIPTVRVNTIMFLHEAGSENQISQILGCWCLSAWDVDRGVAERGTRSWKDAVDVKQGDVGFDPGSEGQEHPRFILDDLTLVQTLIPFILTTIMEPSSTHAALHPSFISGESPASSHLGTPRRSAHPLPPGSNARRVEEGVSVSRAEDNPESIEDRNARIRVGAMGALRWVFEACMPTASIVRLVHSLLSSPMFWTTLHHARYPTFSQANQVADLSSSVFNTPDGFGIGQTIVRRAGWGIVHALMGGRGSGLKDLKWKAWIDQTDDHPSDTIRLISTAILRSAFVEPDSVVRSDMWEPLLIFLTKVNNVWILNRVYEYAAFSGISQGEDDSDSRSESSEEETDLAPTADGSASYTEFLTFLSLGCNGSPLQGYPTVLVILSTIPKEILSPTFSALSSFFDGLWSAIDGQALSTLSTERARGMEAFLGAWGECLVWIAGKLLRGSDTRQNVIERGDSPTGEHASDGKSPREVSRALVVAQFERLTGTLGGSLRMDASVAGMKIASVLEKMENLTRHPDLHNVAWTHISKYVRATIVSPDREPQRKYALFFLAAMHQHLPPGVSKRGLERFVSGIAEEIVKKCLEQSEGEVSQDNVPEHQGSDQELLLRDGRVVEMFLEQFGDILGREEGFVRALDNLLTAKMSSLISQPSFLLSYFKRTPRRLAAWHLLLFTLASSSSLVIEKKRNILNDLLDGIHHCNIGSWAKPNGKELQGLVEQVLAEALNGDSLSSSLIVKLLKGPGPFIEIATAQDLVSNIVTTLDSHIRLVIQAPSASLKSIHSSLGLLSALGEDVSIDQHLGITLANILPHVFVLAFVMPHSFSQPEEMEVVSSARQFWDAWRDRAEDQSRETVAHEVKLVMKDLILDTDVRPRPVAILRALPYINPSMETWPLADVLPTPSHFNMLLSSTSTGPIDRSLAIIEPLAPTCATKAPARGSLWNSKFDSSGFSPYARGVSALLHVLTTDRHVARNNIWALRHVLILALFAREVLQVPGDDSPVFSGQKLANSELREITRLAQQTAALLLTSAVEGSWHQGVVGVLSGEIRHDSLDAMGKFVRLVFDEAKLHDTMRDSLVLHTVLQHILLNATKEDADRWIELARSIEEQALQTSLAISLAVTEFAPEPPKLDRYRNELASKLSGIPSSKVNTAGLRLLRCLSAVAPNPDSDVIFLPQQRAVYVVQALQAWMASDEDVDDGVETEVTLVLFNLAPILQNVPGAHWEFTLDLIESNIESSSFDDSETLVILFRTLRLLKTVQDLAASNKYLRELWGQRSKAIIVLVRNLLAIKTDRKSLSVPRAICREQALSVLQELPGTFMDENTLSRMCHLLIDPSVDNQKMAYQMLQHAAAKRTEHLVLEAGVDSENMAVIELPRELVILLQSTVNFDDTDTGSDPLAYLLGWMITFDLFADASLKVKTGYVDHMRTLDLIGSHFLPNIFELLGVGGIGSFKLDPWIVDEYWLPLYDADAPQSLQLLAAHVYYRALLTVPSLIRTWWEDLKDRQLSAAITAFTSSYFSPVLIASEFIHVKPSSRAAAGEEPLSDGTFNVKVALAVNEVTATFMVDDQQMEIGVKLPAGYPLKTVDVRPIRRVGVPEKVWRKWLFAVQQVVTSHNGRIVDGLALFKKTVSLHFEGQVECAICYSILHVVDRSLPAKPCKTCKNRFHAGCLYKWFNTSHSSSCPLCRSDIM